METVACHFLKFSRNWAAWKDLELLKFTHQFGHSIWSGSLTAGTHGRIDVKLVTLWQGKHLDPLGKRPFPRPELRSEIGCSCVPHLKSSDLLRVILGSEKICPRICGYLWPQIPANVPRIKLENYFRSGRWGTADIPGRQGDLSHCHPPASKGRVLRCVSAGTRRCWNQNNQSRGSQCHFHLGHFFVPRSSCKHIASDSPHPLHRRHSPMEDGWLGHQQYAQCAAWCSNAICASMCFGHLWASSLEVSFPSSLEVDFFSPVELSRSAVDIYNYHNMTSLPPKLRSEDGSIGAFWVPTWASLQCCHPKKRHFSHLDGSLPRPPLERSLDPPGKDPIFTTQNAA